MAPHWPFANCEHQQQRGDLAVRMGGHMGRLDRISGEFRAARSSLQTLQKQSKNLGKSKGSTNPEGHLVFQDAILNFLRVGPRNPAHVRSKFSGKRSHEVVAFAKNGRLHSADKISVFYCFPRPGGPVRPLIWKVATDCFHHVTRLLLQVWLCLCIKRVAAGQ